MNRDNVPIGFHRAPFPEALKPAMEAAAAALVPFDLTLEGILLLFAGLAHATVESAFKEEGLEAEADGVLKRTLPAVMDHAERLVGDGQERVIAYVLNMAAYSFVWQQSEYTEAAKETP